MRPRGADGSPRTVAAQRAWIAAQDERARDDRKGTADRDGRRALAEDRDRADRREKRSARARDRVDEREISRAIPRGERREIERLQTDRDRDEYERGPTERRLNDDEDSDRERREHDRTDDVREKQEGRVRARALRQQIPRRMEDSREHHEAERKQTHAATVGRHTGPQTQEDA